MMGRRQVNVLGGFLEGLNPSIKSAIETRAKESADERKRQKDFADEVNLIFKRGEQARKTAQFKEDIKAAQEGGNGFTIDIAADGSIKVRKQGGQTGPTLNAQGGLDVTDVTTPKATPKATPTAPEKPKDFRGDLSIEKLLAGEKGLRTGQQAFQQSLEGIQQSQQGTQQPQQGVQQGLFGVQQPEEPQPFVSEAEGPTPQKLMSMDQILQQEQQDILSNQFVNRQRRVLDITGGKVGEAPKVGLHAADAKFNDVIANLSLERLKNKQTAADTFNSVAGLMQILSSVWHAAAVEKGGILDPTKTGASAQAFIAGKTGGVAEALDLAKFPQTKAFIGARIETALNLSKLITGGSRIVKDIFKNILKTLPKDNRLFDDFAAKTSQTFKTNFVRALGRPLTRDEIDLIDDQAEVIINTEPARLPENTREEFVFTVDGVDFVIQGKDVGEFIATRPEGAIIEQRPTRG